MQTETVDFTLVLAGVDDKTDGLEDQLFEVQCDDALINFREGAVYLDFTREARSIEDAIISAIRAVESIALPVEVIHIMPDDWVTEADIAERLQQTRQAVSQWVKKERRKRLPFPGPIGGLTNKSPFWRWVDVVHWLNNNQMIDDKKMIESAEFIENANAILGERDPTIKANRHRILKKLS